MEPLGAVLAFCIPLTTGPVPEPTAVVDAYNEAYNRHDLNGMAKVMAADAVVSGRSLEEDATGADIVQSVGENVFTNYPNVRIRVHDRIFAGETVAQTQSYPGSPLEGTRLTTYRVSGGCITGMYLGH